MKIGVLALQGDFERHAHKLTSLGAKTLLVRRAEELKAVDALVLPGGESTALLKLADEHFQSELHDAVSKGIPTLATCAGLILLASKVINPEQSSLGTIDVTVARNAYGRQVDSFIASALRWEEKAVAAFGEKSPPQDRSLPPMEGVFIRAPRIIETGTGVVTLIKHQNDPVLVLQENILAATFHPELSDSSGPLYGLFFGMIKNR